MNCKDLYLVHQVLDNFFPHCHLSFFIATTNCETYPDAVIERFFGAALVSADFEALLLDCIMGTGKVQGFDICC